MERLTSVLTLGEPQEAEEVHRPLGRNVSKWRPRPAPSLKADVALDRRGGNAGQQLFAWPRPAALGADRVGHNKLQETAAISTAAVSPMTDQRSSRISRSIIPRAPHPSIVPGPGLARPSR